MKHKIEEDYNKKNNKTHDILKELNSTLDLYQENNIEVEVGSPNE